MTLPVRPPQHGNMKSPWLQRRLLDSTRCPAPCFLAQRRVSEIVSTKWYTQDKEMDKDRPSGRFPWRPLEVLFLLLCLAGLVVDISLRFSTAAPAEHVKLKKSTATRGTTAAPAKHVKLKESNSTPGMLEYIAIETDTTISDDIVSLTHDPSKSLVTIVLKNTRSPFPVLRGRLSGPALVMLEWNNTDANSPHTYKVLSTTSRLEGYYRAPVVGTYFLEILIIQRSDWKFSSHFETTCLEDPLHNRITKRGVSIRVEHAHRVPIGYWVAKNKSKPLYTRFQPPNCRTNSTDFLSDRCTIPGDMSRFEDYEFHFQTNNTLQAKEMLLKNKKTTICFVGDSHSTASVGFTKKHAKGRPTAASRFYVRFPHQAKPPLLKKGVANLNCTAVVLGIGAWPAGGQPDDRPHLFEEYRSEMSEVIRGIQNMTNVFVRSIFYHPLSDTLTACPPADWRSPRVIDVYNEILRQVCDVHGVPFIDTNFLFGPIWDSPVDWCHFYSLGGEEEALYIASVAFGMDSVKSEL